MGFLEKITGSKKEKEQTVEETDSLQKFPNPCSLCNKQGTDKKWMGQYWHKKCLRQIKKGAKRMF